MWAKSLASNTIQAFQRGGITVVAGMCVFLIFATVTPGGIAIGPRQVSVLPIQQWFQAPEESVQMQTLNALTAVEEKK